MVIRCAAGATCVEGSTIASGDEPAFGPPLHTSRRLTCSSTCSPTFGLPRRASPNEEELQAAAREAHS